MSSRDNQLPCLVRPVQEKPPWSICCRGSMNIPMDISCWMAKELKDYSREFLRKQIGIVEQEPFLFSRSIRENITYGVGRDVPQEEIEKAARAAAIHDVILILPGWLQHPGR